MSREREAAPAPQDDTLSRLISALESLRPGTRRLSGSQSTLIAEYEHFKEALAGPSFRTPPPQITGVASFGGTVRIYGRHLGDVVIVNVAGVRVTRDAFSFRTSDGDEPYIEAEIPYSASVGPVTVFTSGGSATSREEVGRESSAGDAAGARRAQRVPPSRRRPMDEPTDEDSPDETSGGQGEPGLQERPRAE